MTAHVSGFHPTTKCGRRQQCKGCTERAKVRTVASRVGLRQLPRRTGRLLHADVRACPLESLLYLYRYRSYRVAGTERREQRVDSKVSDSALSAGMPIL